MCQNPKCSCQKQINFTPKQFELECGSIKSKLRKTFKGTQAAWNRFSKPAVIVAVPFIDMAVGAKTKNPKVAQAMTKIIKNMSGGKTLSLTDMHGHGLRIRVM